MRIHVLLAVCLALVLAALSAPAYADVEVGDKAPKFESKDDQGKTWKSEDHIGKKIVVLYFYPADMTGGCTKQACGFRDDMQKLKAQGVEVVGVSGDAVKNHQIFKKEYDLNFTLLADEKGDVAGKFGVPTRKGGTITREVDGKTVELTRGVSAARWTFVIDEDGEIALKNTKVKAADDSKAVLKKVEELKGK